MGGGSELQITDAELIAALRAELAAAHRRGDEAEQRLIQTDRPCPSTKVCAGLQGEVEMILRLLSESRRHVASQNEAEGLWDGFGPRRERPTDDLLTRIDTALCEARR